MERENEEAHRRKVEEALEVKSLRRIISAYLNYPEAAEEDVKRWERSLTKLPPHHKVFEPPLDMSQDVDICENQHLDDVSGSHHLSRSRNLCLHESTSASGGVDCHCLAEPSCKETCNGKYSAPTKFNKISSSPPDWLDPSLQLHVPLVDVDKGQKERDQCYGPILEELERLFPNRSKENPPACLVPGAGLGRLALEISCLGFASQGNEFSYYMMICSSFILNHTQAAGEWTIFPWIHSNCNSLSDNDQLRPVSVPDIHPARYPSTCL
ncbi:Topoisomerase II-associated protein PAT1, putative isoform 1 [Capsicum annuum]|nr:Topoisomerase II-associated protein PAT1, putative isoform 1 [Capsicum annuum]